MLMTTELSYAENPRLAASKEALARLLAAERIHVVRGNFPTASFDVVGRVLRKPILLTTNQDVDDLFTFHEVGHALFTPAEGWHGSIVGEKLGHSLVNILEDVRIERLIKAKYPGAEPIFFRAYQELVRNGFFGGLKINSKLGNMHFLDRLNIFAKAAHCFAKIRFTKEEQVFVDAAFATETFEDVHELALRLTKWLKNRETNVIKLSDEEIKKLDELPLPPPGKSKGAGGQGSSSDTATEGGLAGGEYDAFTDNFNHELEKKMSAASGARNAPSVWSLPMEPRVSLVKFDRVSELIKEHLDSWKSIQASHIPENDFWEWASESFNAWSSQVLVGASDLAREFDRRKSASVAMHTRVETTGRLNSKMLSQYQIKDDIFLRRSSVPKGKNHGLVILLDYSGSMDEMLPALAMQAARLVKFASLVGIPCSIYAYTDCIFDPIAQAGARNANPGIDPLAKEMKTGAVYLNYNSTMEIANSRNIKQSLRNLYVLGHRNRNREGKNPYDQGMSLLIPEVFGMGGTPTCSAILALESEVKKLGNQVEVLSFMLLTDGDSENLTPQTYHNDDKYVLVDPKNSSLYSSERYSFATRSGANLMLSMELLQKRVGRKFNTVLFRLCQHTGANSVAAMFNGTIQNIAAFNKTGVTRITRDSSTVSFPGIDSVFAVKANFLAMIPEDEEEAVYDPNKKTQKVMAEWRDAQSRRICAKLLAEQLISDISKIGF